jgi:hypothetical protein
VGGKLSGQISTEYMVVLGIVFIIAVIVAVILGGFIDVGAGVSERESRLYWKTTEIGISNWKVYSNGSGEFVLKNNAADRIMLSRVEANGYPLLEGGNMTLQPGASAKVSGYVGEGTGQYSIDFIFDYETV